MRHRSSGGRPRGQRPPLVARVKIRCKAQTAIRDVICIIGAGLARSASSHPFCTPTLSDGIHCIYSVPPRPLAPARASSGPPWEFRPVLLTYRLTTAPRFGCRVWCRPLGRAVRIRPQQGRRYICAQRCLFLSQKLALTGHYLVDILPHPDLLSVKEHFVTSSWQVLPFVGVEDFEPGDLLVATHAPLMRVLLDALQHNS